MLSLTRCACLALVFFSAAVVRAEDVEAEVEAVEIAPEEHDTFSEAERATITASQETHEFQAEVSRLMDILINSLYSNREIFLRELISNAADALDKVRFLSLTDEDMLKDDEELGIKISYDEEAKTISITDMGVGMTKTDLINNLGIVAKSGTTDFIEAASQSSDSLSLIGQFGVGFYSVYLVADKVTVVSKNDNDDQYIWESAADSVFTISKDPRGNTLGRGTSIILHLKEDAEEFMDEATLTKLVGRYSQFINFPITLRTLKEVQVEVEIEEEAESEADEAEAEAADEEADEEDEDLTVEEDEEDQPTTKTVTEIQEEWKVLNAGTPIWTRNPKDVSEEEYAEFYESLTKDPQGALEKIHFTAEGEITFRAVLYIPKVADPKIYDQFYEKSTGLKLYVRRVLISDEFEDFLPRYMNFIKGIVDSDDLPLNVSRETLAESRVLKVMAKKLTRKVLEMLRKLADRPAEEEGEETDYEKFWAQYSKSIKMGLLDDKKNKAKLIKLLRYKSSTSEGKLTSFEEYVDRMPEDQESIYYLTCADTKACEQNPNMEKFNKKGIEVLFMDEAVDEYAVQHIHEFDGLEPANIMRESVNPQESQSFSELAASDDMVGLTGWLKNTLGDKVSKVKVSNKLVNSPAACVAPEYGWTGNMERIMRAQALQQQKDIAMQVPLKIFEINPYHPIIKELSKRIQADEEDSAAKDMAFILYESAAVLTGYNMLEPEDFAKRINKVVSLSLNLDPEAEVVVPEVVEEEEEEEDEEGEEDEDEF